jgi:hypothetical protein
VDFAPTMVARLEARARAEGLTNIRGRVMDEVRVSRPGGQVLLDTYRPPEEVEF